MTAATEAGCRSQAVGDWTTQVVVVLAGLAHLTSSRRHISRVALICTDSQSLCTALLGKDLQPFSKILLTLAELNSTIHLQWISGHAQAKAAANNNLNLEHPPISLEAASTTIKRFLRTHSLKLSVSAKSTASSLTLVMQSK